MSSEPLFGEGRIQTREDRSQALHQASWLDGAVTFDHRHWVCKDVELRWNAPRHVIVLTERGRTARTRVSSGSDLVYDGQDRPGAVTFVPAGVERYGIYREADLNYSAFWIDPSAEIPGIDRLAQMPTTVNGSDPVMAALLSSLCMDLAGGIRPDAAYVEHLAALLAMRIAALDGNAPSTNRPAPLSRPTLVRVGEFIDAHLQGDISLRDLAAAANMPADTFARRFKTATGMAPYAYVLERRIARAETLLKTTCSPIGNLALALGFSSQSHFTSTFRRLRGTTPRAYRAEFLPGS
ncbi:AraC family transcriptional regulator [Rhizobium sp. LC145]|uniref:helix-turn-helix domain-containing protein n=1 Tax=Rhizobium sp. LC145 TaxID=1120688 RepID=UPI000629F2BB|nr:AraC family transcriptional regulator [Rhizobium sp. LC145]KKX32942.1 AraC family transcriptional regulator [Rhizobium sp. LC145]TKT57356.1 helix-turn-helix transcriptional regulator [Rhizobiaceae bacterium LC148]